MSPFTCRVFGKTLEQCCAVKLLRSQTFHWHCGWLDNEWIFNSGKTLPLSPLGAGNQLTAWVVAGEMGTSWGCKEAPGPTWLDTWPGLKPTQAVKEGRGTLRPLGARTKGHQYLPGLRPWPAAGRTERWCPSPRQPCPPGPADGPGISQKSDKERMLTPYSLIHSVTLWKKISTSALTMRSMMVSKVSSG